MQSLNQYPCRRPKLSEESIITSEGSVLGSENAHSCIVIVWIDDLEIQIDNIGPGPLGDCPHGRLWDDVSHDKPLVR